MDPDVYRRLKALESRVKELEARDYATYNTIYAANEPTDHFFNPTLNSAWSWQGAPFGGAPAIASLDRWPSHLTISSSAGAATKYFLSRAAPSTAPSAVSARMMISSFVVSYLRIDDGTDNNSVELGVVDSATGGLMDIVVRTRTGGITVNTAIVAVPCHPITFLINKSSTSGADYFYTLEAHRHGKASTAAPFRYLTSTAGATWNPSRYGIAHVASGAYTASGIFASFWDWINFEVI